MASSLSHRFLCVHTLQQLKSPTLPSKAHCFTRLRVAAKSSPQKNTASTDSLESPCQKRSTLSPPHNSSSDDSFSSPLHRFRNEWLKFDELGMEIFSIALPAALALAADPLASLVDTAFIGHIGSVELAAVGVSASVFNLASKVFNVPLLNITTSFVAEEQALFNKEDDSSQSDDNDFLGKYQRKKLLPSVSTSLALATTLGIAEAVAISLGSGILLNIMGFSHAWTCRAVSYIKGLWCSTNCDCISCTRSFSWICRYKDASICCWCWQLS